MSCESYTLVLLTENTAQAYNGVLADLREILPAEAEYRFSPHLGLSGGFLTFDRAVYLHFLNHFVSFSAEGLRKELLTPVSDAATALHQWVIKVFAAKGITLVEDSVYISAIINNKALITMGGRDELHNSYSVTLPISHVLTASRRTRYIRNTQGIRLLKSAIIRLRPYLDACKLLGYTKGTEICSEAASVMGYALAKCQEENENESV